MILLKVCVHLRGLAKALSCQLFDVRRRTSHGSFLLLLLLLLVLMSRKELSQTCGDVGMLADNDSDSLLSVRRLQ